MRSFFAIFAVLLVSSGMAAAQCKNEATLSPCSCDDFPTEYDCINYTLGCYFDTSTQVCTACDGKCPLNKVSPPT
ncbi:hypothetical protein BJ138DRAFT_904035 [Hygrophoropsis aurantiaca]|uniref:Uncharacterized protein n=1 Tax=Hygrophoropsis aurantiaca TaxID=72124 RepID=A0ACB8AEA7_9AGAM|nr:hypothetical protein BJ138DRAFT_904035 [Hygrophoropsis aurantiaca]